MKLNQEKVREALRIKEELYKECEVLSNGIRIARNVFPSSGIFSWMLQGRYDVLFEATETCRRTQVTICAFDIDKLYEEYRIWYERLQIYSLEEYLRCRQNFKRDFLPFFGELGEEHWQLLGEDYRKNFSERVTAFLDKLEEAFKD